MGERCNSNEEDLFQSSSHRPSTVGEDRAFDAGTRQTTHLLQRMADEEEERRRLQVQDAIIRIRMLYEAEMKCRARASAEALEQTDRLVAEQMESMQRRVDEVTRQAEKDRRDLEERLKEERVENHWQGPMQVTCPYPITDEYTYIRSLLQPRHGMVQAERPERDVTQYGEEESSSSRRDARGSRLVVDYVDAPRRTNRIGLWLDDEQVREEDDRVCRHDGTREFTRDSHRYPLVNRDGEVREGDALRDGGRRSPLVDLKRGV
jgi:hypothetical protein